MKIALAGSAGTGRTTIAKQVALSINHFPLTNLAKSILRSEGFKYGTEQTVEEFLATKERQVYLYQRKKEKESELEDFVTDRSWLDLAAYCIYGMQNNTDFDISAFISDCKDEVEKYDAIIHIPWGRQPLQPNGTRTINPWFQFMIDSIICRLANQWKVQMIEIDATLENTEAVNEIFTAIKCINPKIEIKSLKAATENPKKDDLN